MTNRMIAHGNLAVLAGLLMAGFAWAADAPRDFASDTARYFAAHDVAGLKTFQDLLRLGVSPEGESAAIDTAVQPCHKAKRIRCWGPMMVPVFRAWGLDAAEFDPDAFARGELPDVIFITQSPNYAQGDVEMIFRAAAEGVHVVTLSSTDQWSAAIAKRLGFAYDGVLTIGPPDRGGILFPNCPKLVDGLVSKPRLDAAFKEIGQWLHGMYLTGDRCLMGVADISQGRIATAVAQYPVGRGAVTLFGPRLYEKPDLPVCKRMLLNLIDLRDPAPAALGVPFIYHPDPPGGKPYFELRVPGTRDEYLTEARPKDHIWHLGLFFSWKFINGCNFWEPNPHGATRVVSHREEKTASGARFTAELAYALDGRVILRENRTVNATLRPDGNYAFDWTGRFEALDDLAFTASKPEWDKEKGTCNGNGYAGISARLAKNAAFAYTYTNALGSVDARCYGDSSRRIDVYAKSKRSGETTRLSFIADKPTVNYTLHWPERNDGDGFHFIAFPEMFNTTLQMKKGEKRDFHYTVEVSKDAGPVR